MQDWSIFRIFQKTGKQPEVSHRYSPSHRDGQWDRDGDVALTARLLLLELLAPEKIKPE
jgi:hypothetical protein